MRQAVVAFGLVLALGGPALAETLVVKGGSSANLKAALASALDGDVIEIRGGVITIRAKGRVVIDGEGSTWETGLTVENVTGLTIVKVVFRNHEDDGIGITGSSGFTARKCTFIDCRDAGIQDQATAGYTVEDCRFIRCDWGLACGYATSGSTDVSISGCRFIDCVFYGIDLWASDALVEDNRFKGEDNRVTKTTGNTIADNVVRKSATVDLESTVSEGSNTFVGNTFGTSSFP